MNLYLTDRIGTGRGTFMDPTILVSVILKVNFSGFVFYLIVKTDIFMYL